MESILKNKRKDIQIFELAHIKTDYPLDDNKLYTPLQTGASISSTDVCILKDNVGDNISSTNYFFCEETGTYWIWKHISGYKYLGQCQYRRRLKFDEDTDFDKLFENYDIIVPVPYMYRQWTLKEHYMVCHIEDDIKYIESAVKRLYPDYAEDYDRYINRGNILFYSASYVMRESDYKRWCEFFFTIMDDFRDNYLDYTDEELLYKHAKTRECEEDKIIYQTRIGGYLQERLFTLWVLHNFKTDHIYTMNYTLMEDQESMSKITYIK